MTDKISNKNIAENSTEVSLKTPSDFHIHHNSRGFGKENITKMKGSILYF